MSARRGAGYRAPENVQPQNDGSDRAGLAAGAELAAQLREGPRRDAAAGADRKRDLRAIVRREGEGEKHGESTPSDRAGARGLARERFGDHPATDGGPRREERAERDVEHDVDALHLREVARRMVRADERQAHPHSRFLSSAGSTKSSGESTNRSTRVPFAIASTISPTSDGFTRP